MARMNARRRPPTAKQRKVDRLKGKKVCVGAKSLTVIKQIGEGGSAFIYLARTDTSPPMSNLSDSMHDNLSIVSEPCDVARSSWAMSDCGDGDGDENSSIGASHDSACKKRNRRSLLFKMRSGLGGSSRSSLGGPQRQNLVVLKAAAVAGSSTRRRQVETEVRMLRRFAGHPNVVRLLDSGFGESCASGGNAKGRLHFTVLEHCPFGSLMDLILRQRRILLDEGSRTEREKEGILTDLKTGRGSSSGMLQKLNNVMPRSGRSDGQTGSDSLPCTLSTDNQGYIGIGDILAIFKQISTTVEFLHSQYDIDEQSSASVLRQTRRRLPVVHRDIKPENILIAREGAGRWHVKLCDFGSAIEGIVPLRNPNERYAAHEQIRRSTTQMYRAPEMVDVHSVNELTEKTDVWALGCSLYTTCFLQNCFEENSSLAILAGKFSVPRRHPYDQQVLDFIQRMLIVDASHRANMEEVCDCIEALQAGRPLPPRPRPSSARIVDSPDHVPAPPVPTASNKKAKRSTVVSSRASKVSIGKGLNTKEVDGIATSAAVRSVPLERKTRNDIAPNSAAGRRSLRAQQRKMGKPNAKRAISADHIYGDLEAVASQLKTCSTSPDKSDANFPGNGKTCDSRGASQSETRDESFPESLFGPEEEWADFERALQDDAIDRINVFTSEERRHTSNECSDDSTPLAELSSVTSASSEDICVTVRESDFKMIRRSQFL